MSEIAKISSCKISADEGLHSLDDIKTHHTARAAQGGSLKTIKLGGITKAFQAIELFKKLGMSVNLAGKTAETSIASAAVLHIAAAAPDLSWGVSPTAPYLSTDVVRNPIKVYEGHADPPEGWGLGIEVDEDKLSELTRTI